LTDTARPANSLGGASESALTAEAVAHLVGGELRGDPTVRVVRVAALDEPGPAPLESSMFVLAVPISSDGLQRSIQRIAATIETASDGAPVLSEQDGVAPGVTMYRSLEIYHAVHSCNFWVAEVLGAGGIHDAVALDLFPETLYVALRAAGASPVTPTDLTEATAVELRREAAVSADQSVKPVDEAAAPADMATR